MSKDNLKTLIGGVARHDDQIGVGCAYDLRDGGLCPHVAVSIVCGGVFVLHAGIDKVGIRYLKDP